MFERQKKTLRPSGGWVQRLGFRSSRLPPSKLGGVARCHIMGPFYLRKKLARSWSRIEPLELPRTEVEDAI